MIRAGALAAAALAVAWALACGGDGPDSPSDATATASAPAVAASGCAPALPREPGTTDVTLSSGGVDRTYILHIPPHYDGSSRLPVVFNFHGYSLTAPIYQALTGFNVAADEAGYVVVTPNGQGVPQYWNVFKPGIGKDDIGFFTDMLAELQRTLCIDPARVYAAGYSMGGGMAQRLACEMPDQLAGIAMVASSTVTCSADVPMLAFHGTLDNVVPFEGGRSPISGRISYAPIRQILSEWARASGCDGLPTISHPSPAIELSTFQRCGGGESQVLLYTVIGGGHTWPGGAVLGDPALTTREINASSRILEFFDELAQ